MRSLPLSCAALLACTAVVVADRTERLPQPALSVADHVMRLTRASTWRLVQTLPVAFRTFHPQGMVRIGDAFFVSSVEVTTAPERFATPTAEGYDRSTGSGVGHLFKIDAQGRLAASLILGEGSAYHPGGIDFDGRHIWVPVAEYRPDSRSLLYRVDPASMTATEVLRVADHIGGLVHDVDGRTLRGVSWGSRRFYRWTLDAAGRVTNAGAPLDAVRSANPSHYVDYQDCKYAGSHRMLCSGVSDLRASADTPPFRLGGLDLIDLTEGRPIHQVPITLTTPGGRSMAQNPSFFEATGSTLRGYFMPDDDTSTIYVYEVDTR